MMPILSLSQATMSCSKSIHIHCNTLRMSFCLSTRTTLESCLTDSIVFRSMISMANSNAQRDPIILTDERLENSQVVKKVLDNIYNLDIGEQKTDRDMFLLRYVIDFAKKWEMETVLKMIQKEMWRRIDSKSETPDSFYHFLIALALGDHKLAATYFASPTTQTSIQSAKPAVAPSTNPVPDSEDEDESDDSSEEEDESESDSNDSSEDESEPSGASGMAQKMEIAASATSTDIPWLPPYLSDDLSDNLLTSSLQGKRYAFDLNCMPYREFLLLSPTVVWIILQVQGPVGRNWSRQKQIECMDDLLNKACKSSSHVIFRSRAEYRSSS
jgi:hypothetical protein